MRYFGVPYPSGTPAPVYEEAEQVPTPVSEVCPQCELPIRAGDNGFIVPFWSGGEASEQAWHRRCWNLATLGPGLVYQIEEENNETL
jgi:hypothetical protein